jgi:hypothetical protein
MNANLCNLRPLGSEANHPRANGNGEGEPVPVRSGDEMDFSAGAQNLRAVSGCTCGCGRKAAGVARLAHCETCQGEGDVIYESQDPSDPWIAVDAACIGCVRRKQC